MTSIRLVEALGWEFDHAPWTTRAACAGKPARLFFPARGESVAPARAICADCPVRQECLEYALRWRVVHGIWGGLSEQQRRRLTKPPLPTQLLSPPAEKRRLRRQRSSGKQEQASSGPSR